MNLQQNLTEENFFNDIMVKYPNATKEFCEWVDNYKRAASWNELFNDGKAWAGGVTKAPEFHEVPYAMQFGICLTYINGFEESHEFILRMMDEPFFVDSLADILDCFFAIREMEISQPNN